MAKTGIRRLLALIAICSNLHAFILPYHHHHHRFVSSRQSTNVQRKAGIHMMAADSPLGIGVIGCGRIGQVSSITFHVGKDAMYIHIYGPACTLS